MYTNESPSRDIISSLNKIYQCRVPVFVLYLIFTNYIKRIYSSTFFFSYLFLFSFLSFSFSFLLHFAAISIIYLLITNNHAAPQITLLGQYYKIGKLFVMGKPRNFLDNLLLGFYLTIIFQG